MVKPFDSTTMSKPNFYYIVYDLIYIKNFFPQKCLKFLHIVIIILLQTSSGYKIQSKPDLT